MQQLRMSFWSFVSTLIESIFRYIMSKYVVYMFAKQFWTWRSRGARFDGTFIFGLSTAARYKQQFCSSFWWTVSSPIEPFVGYVVPKYVVYMTITHFLKRRYGGAFSYGLSNVNAFVATQEKEKKRNFHSFAFILLLRLLLSSTYISFNFILSSVSKNKKKKNNKKESFLLFFLVLRRKRKKESKKRKQSTTLKIEQSRPRYSLF